MMTRRRVLGGLFVLAALVLAAGLPAQTPGLPPVTMSTALGEIVIEVDTVHAPITGRNFLRYVDAGLYDGGRFYRTVTTDNQPDDDVRIAVIQGGIAPDRRGERFSSIPLERTTVTGLHHLDGTVSLARAGPDTGSSEFFICIGDQPALDYAGERNPDGQGFAAFGRVVQGMDVVRRIHAQPAAGQQLQPAVEISRVRRE